MPVTNLAVSNRTQLAYKTEGTYPLNFGVVPAGNGTLLNTTGEAFDFSQKTESSKQLRADRQVQDIVVVGASAQGSFNFEAQYKEYDPFLEALFQTSFSNYGTGGVSAAGAGTLAATATTWTASTAPTGADAFTGLDKGQWFVIIPPAAASAAVKAYLSGRAFRASTTTAPTTTVITLDPATPIDTTIITAPLAAGWKLSSSKLYNAPATPTLKTFTIEVQHQDIAQFRQYTGMMPSKMELNLSVGSIVTGMFEFMGKTMNLMGASSMGTAAAAQSFTPANATKGVFDVFEGGASVSATTYIKSAKISYDNTLRGQDAVGAMGNVGIASGTMNVTGSLEVYFADATMYAKFLNNTASSFALPILDASGNGYVFVFPRIKYTAAKANSGQLDQDTMLSMEFQALPDTDPTSATYNKSVAVFRVGN